MNKDTKPDRWLIRNGTHIATPMGETQHRTRLTQTAEHSTQPGAITASGDSAGASAGDEACGVPPVLFETLSPSRNPLLADPGLRDCDLSFTILEPQVEVFRSQDFYFR
jgi:hypothetical protein